MVLKRRIKMLLSEILKGVSLSSLLARDCEIEDIIYDSRKAKKDTLFVCLSGARFDGHDFAEKAYKSGCRTFLCEKEVPLPKDANILVCENTRAALAVCSKNFFRDPSSEIAVIGITGTKGKTTVAHIVRAVLEGNGIKCGIIGTIGAKSGNKALPTVNTTPESYELQKLLRIMADDGCTAAAIEVSSLGLKHHRVDGVQFDTAVFTNLSPDHIGTNEHASFEEYAYWKKQLFKMCKKAVVNSDDEFSREVLDVCTCPAVTFGFDQNADFRLIGAKNMKRSGKLGVDFSYIEYEKEKSFFVSLPGDVNAYNAVCACAVAKSFGVSDESLRKSLSSVYVKGRGEIVETGRDFSVIIDYAHNGVSLKSIVETIREYETKRIIAVFGSVGGKSEIRRKELGLVAGAMCDLSIVTSDDPDFEDPEKICREIASYVEEAHGKYVIIPDRKKAILYALSAAQEGDVVLLAGKGHEEFIKIKGEKLPFSERKIVEEALNRS